MERGKSSLNPNAEPYIPLSSRAAADAYRGYSLTTNNYMSGNEAFWFIPDYQSQSNAFQKYIAHSLVFEDYIQKRNSFYGSYGLLSKISKEITEKPMPGDEFKIDLAYLQMVFPQVSEETISDMYWENGGDMIITVNMLNHFKLSPIGYSENFPGTGNVSGSGSSSGRACLKLKIAADDVGSSSSCPKKAHIT